jgi:hypothetical protein
VALRPIEPFSRPGFQAAVAPFVAWATDHVATTAIGGRCGWVAHLHTYRWKGVDWRGGLTQRRDMALALRRATTPAELAAAVAAVPSWGDMRDLSADDLSAVVASFPVLDRLREGTGADWQAVHARRIAATSKVYAMRDLDSWTIYDSRVGFALARIIDRWWERGSRQELPALLGLAVPPERGPRRSLPAGFARIGSTRQAGLAFIYASWLVEAIAAQLAARDRRPDGDRWRLAHVEMALFVMGDRSTNWDREAGEPPARGD